MKLFPPLLTFSRTCALLGVVIGWNAGSVWADVTLGAPFSENAVFQRDEPVPVWGKADPGEKVTVTFGGQTKQTTADAEGRWKVALDPLPASKTPAVLTVKGNNTVEVGNILVGEVWLCSGQSNMAWPVKTADNFAQEKAEANYPLIRQLSVEKTVSETPADTVKSEWIVCSPETVENFTAVGYFFGRELFRELDVPVGLISSSWGGTQIESWISAKALQDPKFENVLKRWKKLLEDFPEMEKAHAERLAAWQKKADEAKARGEKVAGRPPRAPEGPGSRFTPSGLYNGMIAPLVPYAIRGVIWYQGETNAPRFSEYGDLFTTMITQWRADFGQGDFPFYFVQLANLERKMDPSGVQWAFQREAQTAALSLPETGMAVTIDIGDANDIHPRNKQDVGRRLARHALNGPYQKPREVSGPVFAAAKPEGNAVKVTFTHADGLKLTSASEGFEVAGEDRVFHPAEAKVEGGSVVVSSSAVAQPVAVRYAWKNNPAATLFNGEGLPAAPFRSDDWPAPDNASAPE